MIDRTIVQVAAEPDIHAICSDAVTKYAKDMDNLYANAKTRGQEAVADFADALAAAEQQSAVSGRAGWADKLDTYLWYVKNGEGTYDASQEAALKAELVGRLNEIDPDVVATLNALTAKVDTVGFGRNQTECTEIQNMYQTVLDTLARTSPVGGNTGDPYTGGGSPQTGGGGAGDDGATESGWVPDNRYLVAELLTPNISQGVPPTVFDADPDYLGPFAGSATENAYVATIQNVLVYTTDEIIDLITHAAKWAEHFGVDVVDLLCIILKEAAGFPNHTIANALEDLGVTTSNGPSNIQYDNFNTAIETGGLAGLLGGESAESVWQDLWDHQHMEVMVAATASFLSMQKEHAAKYYETGGSFEYHGSEWSLNEFAVALYNVSGVLADDRMYEAHLPGPIMQTYLGEIRSDRASMQNLVCTTICACTLRA